MPKAILTRNSYVREKAVREVAKAYEERLSSLLGCAVVVLLSAEGIGGLYVADDTIAQERVLAALTQVGAEFGVASPPEIGRTTRTMPSGLVAAHRLDH